MVKTMTAMGTSKGDGAVKPGTHGKGGANGSGKGHRPQQQERHPGIASIGEQDPQDACGRPNNKSAYSYEKSVEQGIVGGMERQGDQYSHHRSHSTTGQSLGQFLTSLILPESVLYGGYEPSGLRRVKISMLWPLSSWK